MRASLSAAAACITALTAGLLPASALASYYESAEVRAEAGGIVLDLRDGQTRTGDGSTPQVARGAKSFPAVPDGNSGGFAADARASLGSLSASGSLSITRAVSGVFAISPDAEVQSEASFRDEWMIAGQPMDTIGRMRITTHFDGTAGSSSTVFSDAWGRYELDITSLEGFNNVHDSAGYNSQRQTSIDQTATLELDFRYGRPILLNALLIAVVQMDAPTSTVFAGSGHASFGNTASITRLEVRGADGVFTTAFDLQTLSGGLYPFMTPVPEPGTGVLMLGGLALAGWVVVRRQRTMAAAA